MKYVLQLLPSWIKFGDVERVGWLNHLLQTLWPYVSNAVEKVVKGSVQPILDSYASTAIGSLKLEHCNLGTLPPKVVGVRSIQSDDSVFRLDVDLLYCGNPGVRQMLHVDGRIFFLFVLYLYFLYSMFLIFLTPLSHCCARYRLSWRWVESPYPCPWKWEIFSSKGN